ncbi:hypothetical protein KGQ31_00470 [Patescibacteria group bacterium]|nr:hypothetical protein [Patescibacteria group bacterium]
MHERQEFKLAGHPNTTEVLPTADPDESSSMGDFRREIADLKMREESRHSGAAHLTFGQNVDVGELTEADLAMWRKVRDYPSLGRISKTEFDAYQAVVAGNVSRFNFSAFLANKIAPIWVREFRAHRKQGDGARK